MQENIDGMVMRIKNGDFDEKFQNLYVDPRLKELQKERYLRALNQFRTIYGDSSAEVYSAPGRTEIGGNHTDHQYGKVLAASVNLDAIAVVSKREDNNVLFHSEGYSSVTVNLNDLTAEPREEGTTAALVRGVAAGMRKWGLKTGGFNAYVTSQVIGGSGLSSSAAIETLVGNIFSGLFNGGAIDPVRIAQIGQFAENDYFGKPSGLMDQMACSVGGLIHIDFKDPAEPEVKQITVDFERFKHSLCILDTKGSHADLTPDYAAIPEEMRRVASYFSKEVLREVSEEDFYAELTLLRKYAGDRAVLRAVHWFDEEKRVDLQAEALKKGDFEQFKSLIRSSGESSYKYLQNVYAPHKYKEQSVALALLLSQKRLGDNAACRVHGGGFAGTIQAFIPDPEVKQYKNYMEQYFGRDSCYVLKIRPVGGLRVL
jgi:galactokinase